MKLAFQLAYKNLVGSGLRTWLNVGVLSFAFVVIIFYNGLLEGWNQQAKREAIAWEFGSGQLLNDKYDPYDPFSIQEGHGTLAVDKTKNLTPIFITQASIYPQGRMMSIALKGIDPQQQTIQLPTQLLSYSKADIPAIIGKRMAAATNLKKGDQVLLRWRDKNGTFDAADITIADVFDAQLPTIDNGQIWIPLTKLWQMTGQQGQVTLFVANKEYVPEPQSGWNFRGHDILLKDLNEIIASKKVSGSIMYTLLIAIALLAIFDTQVLSIFRRQKEIGTYIALGMTRLQVVGLFTVEGSMYSFLATIVGSLYGLPLLWYIASVGIAMPAASQEMGITVPERIFPVYGFVLLLSTIVLVVVAATIVSFLPARKIAKMNPVDALKGKIQ